MNKLIPLLFLASCGSVLQNSDLMSFEFRRTMPIKINGIEGVGVMVIPKAPHYQIRGKIKGVADVLFLDTCHRELFWEKQGELDYDYQPKATIEDNRACPIEVVALNKNAKHSLAFIDFEDERNTLPAELICDTAVGGEGVSICQAVVGKIQKIVFESEVLMEPGAGHEECRIIEPIDKKTYEFRPIKGICTVKFQELQPPHRKHRMTVLGVDANILQEL